MGDSHLPSVRLGKAEPGKIQNYEKAVIDGVEVYYTDTVPANYKTIKIYIEKLFFFKSLAIAGEK